MGWAPGSGAAWQPGRGEAAAAPEGLVLSHTPAQIVIEGQQHALLGTTVLSHQPAQVVWEGQDLGFWKSGAWQYVEVTDLSLIGEEPTLFDSLDGVTPAVGDYWRVPTFSADGGAVTVLGNGRFTIGEPTSGEDTLPAVMYYDTSEATWHGPVDITIDDPISLEHTPAEVTITGQVHTLVSGVTLTHLPAQVVIEGQEHEFAVGGVLELHHDAAEVVIEGQVHALETGLLLTHQPAAIEIQGQQHALLAGLSLGHQPAAVQILGQEHSLWSGRVLGHVPAQIEVQGQLHTLDVGLTLELGHVPASILIEGQVHTLQLPTGFVLEVPLRISDATRYYVAHRKEDRVSRRVVRLTVFKDRANPVTLALKQWQDGQGEQAAPFEGIQRMVLMLDPNGAAPVVVDTDDSPSAIDFSTDGELTFDIGALVTSLAEGVYECRLTALDGLGRATELLNEDAQRTRVLFGIRDTSDLP